MLLLALSAPAQAQRLATLQVQLPAPGLPSAPVSIDLDALTALPDSALSLVEVRAGHREAVPFQVTTGEIRRLHWLVEAGAGRSGKRTYELRQAPQPRAAAVRTVDAGGAYVVQFDDVALLQYNYRTVRPPAGVDSAFRRSGFIHPLRAPQGQVLTRIQPPDHYHHYGLWNPWTHVLFEGDTVDFWNLRARKGLVRFAQAVATTSGPVFGEFRVVHEHVALKPDGRSKVALNELQTVRVYRPGRQPYYLVDLTVQLSCASASPVRLLTYRYGGLGWRGPEQWTRANSLVLTSGGQTRKDADGARARWLLVQGPLVGGSGGLALLSHPANYNHPEPLRVWPETQNGRGDVFVNFSPTKNTDWLLQPGQTYTLRYRLLVFNGEGKKEDAEASWQQFGQPPRVTVKRR